MKHTQDFGLCAAALIGAASICLIPPAWGQPTVNNKECQDDGQCAKGAPTCCRSAMCNYCEESLTPNRRCKVATGLNCHSTAALDCSDYVSAFCQFHGAAGEESDCSKWSCDSNGTLGNCGLAACATP